MSPPEADEQRERREVLANDRRVREQQQKAGSTYFQHAVNEADEPRGRFQDAGGTTTVIGATLTPKYPELPSTSPSHRDPVPDEPPLGYAVDEMVPLETPSAVSSPAEPGSASADAPSVFLPVPEAPRAAAGPLSNNEEEDDAA
jgi:hypothetical protein